MDYTDPYITHKNQNWWSTDTSTGLQDNQSSIHDLYNYSIGVNSNGPHQGFVGQQTTSVTNGH